jgi:chemotaxis methyl-accepting protein methylase
LAQPLQTGEEAYTLAMIVLKSPNQCTSRAIPDPCSDINKSVLKQAQQGVYKEYSIECSTTSAKKIYSLSLAHTIVLSG